MAYGTGEPDTQLPCGARAPDGGTAHTERGP